MHQEMYSLTWYAYSDHLKCMMKELMMNEDFSDVTLVTEDKKQIKANINVLSACSPVFKDTLKKDKNSSPIMYLRGIQSLEIESIMQFIYLGEATFYEERMEEFLAVAKSLEIKELCNTEAATSDEHSPVEKYEKLTLELNSDQILKQLKQERDGKVIYTNSKYDDVQYACDKCDFKDIHQSNLKRHIQSKHEGIKHACNQCDYQGSRQDYLAGHIKSKHESVRYDCDQCNHQFTSKGNLSKHIQSKHEGVKYGCDQCDYQFISKGNLSKHFQSKHEGVKYECDQCDYQASTQSSLSTHKHRHSKLLQ